MPLPATFITGLFPHTGCTHCRPLHTPFDLEPCYPTYILPDSFHITIARNPIYSDCPTFLIRGLIYTFLLHTLPIYLHCRISTGFPSHWITFLVIPVIIYSLTTLPILRFLLLVRTDFPGLNLQWILCLTPPFERYAFVTFGCSAYIGLLYAIGLFLITLLVEEDVTDYPNLTVTFLLFFPHLRTIPRSAAPIATTPHLCFTNTYMLPVPLTIVPAALQAACPDSGASQ